MKQRVQLPAYLPDQSNNSGVLLTAKNVYPAADGYRPVGSVATVSDALSGTFMGGYSAIAANGTAFLLAGNATNLYSLQSDGSWTSLVGSLTITARWRFTQFKDYVIAVNASATREIDLSGPTDSALSGAPTGTTICVIGDHVVIGQAGGDISKVQWSAFNDHTGWTAGVDQSGFQNMQVGGAVQAIVGGEFGVILQRQRIVRMTRTGISDTPFQFDEISSEWGCADGATVAQAGRTVFFLSDRGFMALDDGQAPRPIGSEKVDRTFLGLVERDSFNLIYTAVDPQNKLVFWGVPGSPGTMWIYNFELDRWSTAELTFSGIFPGFTTSYALDDLPGLGYTDLDAMTISLDDPRWQGGNPRLYLIDVNNKLGTLAGTNLAATIETGFNEFNQGMTARVSKVTPVSNITSGLTLTVDGRQRLGDSASTSSSSTINSTGTMSVRKKGRHHAFKFVVAAATDWNYIQGFEAEYETGGLR